MAFRIALTEFELSLHIGCSAQERLHPQPVRIALTLTGARPFAASQTDALLDTVDTDRLRAVLVNTLESATRDATLQTLERLAQIAADALSREFHQFPLQWELLMVKPQFGWSYAHTWSS